MPEATVTWVEGMRFIGTDSTNHSVVLSSSKEGIGMKPSELLLVSLGSCTGVDVVNILRKKRAKVTDVKILVKGEQATDYPHAFTCFHVHYAVTGYNLKEADVVKAIELSEEKYCSVSATLKGSATITWDYEIIEAD